ncbi:MAG TPA: VOC family protein [Stellaceae bacterium]|nr:VOC family protein [Stellaceae bacterium]
MPLPVAALDHAVVNALDRMDEAVACYRRLGFRLTERGYHTLGSINHLAVFRTNYLELIGYERGARQVRTDILRFPVGLNALVLAAEDADATYRGLQAAQVAAEAPIAFARPVAIGGATQEARFRTVRLPPDSLPSGRVYFCQHLTRELVWRAEWQDHPNGAQDIVRALVAARDPRRGASIFAAMFDAAALREIAGGVALDLGNMHVAFVTPDRVAATLGAAAPAAAGRADYMAALTLRTASLDAAAAAIAPEAGARREPGRLIVPAAAAMDTALEFVAS